MYFEDFYVGQTWQIAPFQISREQIIDFASRYDPLPIHVDEEYARTSRFGGLIASGPMSFMLFWTEFFRTSGALDSGLIAGLRNRMEWFLPTRPGDSLQGTVSVIAVHSRNGYNGEVAMEIKGYNQDGVFCMAGGADICFEKRPQTA
ncbi:MAG: MaoC family dehydratase N-terminal domain-containing protein [Actinomycetia bacterium]|nr:MaoC family dehydratase N-terminal domain-containing protein [Actinomycetes bacterium]